MKLALPLLALVLLPASAPAAVLVGFAIFSDDFESGQGDWTTGSDGEPGTAWELGTPAVVGPAAAYSGLNAFGTNIASDYAFGANVWLRSPAIDLSGLPDAALRYFQYLDSEVAFDPARVSILSALDSSEVAVLQFDHGSVVTSWQETSFALPPEAFDQPIVFEFRLQTDPILNYPGWYIDDVQVTSTIPEPSGFGLLALGSLVLLPGTRRR